VRKFTTECTEDTQEEKGLEFIEILFMRFVPSVVGPSDHEANRRSLRSYFKTC